MLLTSLHAKGPLPAKLEVDEIPMGLSGVDQPALDRDGGCPRCVRRPPIRVGIGVDPNAAQAGTVEYATEPERSQH
jgi:hypothetical protein